MLVSALRPLVHNLQEHQNFHYSLIFRKSDCKIRVKLLVGVAGGAELSSSVLTELTEAG